MYFSLNLGGMAMLTIRKIVSSATLVAVVFSSVFIFGMNSKADDTPLYTLGGTAHVQDVGDMQGTFTDGTLVLGTRGYSRRVEAVNISFQNNTGYEGTIKYKVHVQNVGWTKYCQAGETAGTQGQSLRLEGIVFRLTGDLEKHYTIQYRVHIQDIGDGQGWVNEGQLAGTQGQSKRLEEVAVRLVPRDSSSAPQALTDVTYRVHRQNYGWETLWAENGEVSGTTGEGLRLEAINLKVTGSEYTGGITYRTHIQDIGWQDWKSDGDLSGTEGQSKRLEAIEIKLTGELANHYQVYYRVHCQDYGWLLWARDGESSGSAGMSKRLEAIQICLVPTGTSFSDTSVIDCISTDYARSAFVTYKDADPILYYNYAVKYASGLDLLNSHIGTPHRTYTYYDSITGQSKTKTISDNEWTLLQDFANTHFRPEMTTAERLMYTMYWVHNNIDYAAASKGYAYNAFVSHKGQCNTYNGLTVEMMCFLGYDNVTLVRGTWTTSPHHYWGVITIDGVSYVMEAGNKKDSVNFFRFAEVIGPGSKYAY